VGEIKGYKSWGRGVGARYKEDVKCNSIPPYLLRKERKPYERVKSPKG